MARRAGRRNRQARNGTHAPTARLPAVPISPTPVRLSITATLDYILAAPAPALFQLEAAAIVDEQEIVREECVPGDGPARGVLAPDAIGIRRWVEGKRRLTLDYSADVAVTRVGETLAGLAATPLTELPDEVIGHLFSSRYCPVPPFARFVASEFAGLNGGALVDAIREFVATRFAYTPGASDADTDAVESFVRRTGVCRDYAHVTVALARAANIPARFVSAYAVGVDPPDFHALAQVYLADGWHLVDATGMSLPEETAIIGVGSDAAEVSFLTVFGAATLARQDVRVTRTA
jgi:hypothetical protein